MNKNENWFKNKSQTHFVYLILWIMRLYFMNFDINLNILVQLFSSQKKLIDYIKIVDESDENFKKMDNKLISNWNFSWCSLLIFDVAHTTVFFIASSAFVSIQNAVNGASESIATTMFEPVKFFNCKWKEKCFWCKNAISLKKN